MARFEHKWADAAPYHVQTYLKLDSEDGHARALVLAYARRYGAHGCEILVGVRLVAMRLETGRAAAKWSVSLEARTAANHHIGARHSHYISCPNRGERRRRPFRTDTAGVLDWIDYPESIRGTWRGGYPCNWSPELETTAAALGMTVNGRTVVLDLVLTETAGGNTIRLCGPEIRVPERIWYEHPPKTPGWFASLNVSAMRGLRQKFARAVRYRAHVRERQRATRDFVVR